MNRPFTNADSGKRFSIGINFGALEFPVEDPGPAMPDDAGILWLDKPYALGPKRIGWLYVVPAEVEPIPDVKGLSVSVYRDHLGDCTNGGVTATVTEALLVGPVIDKAGGNVFGPRPGQPVLVIEPWKGAYRAVPWLPDDEPRPWFMFGGNFVYTSDSRMPRAGLNGWSLPIPVHDRVER